MISFLFCFLSVAELEKLYSFAVSGSPEEKLAASKILCGASLLRGWNIQVLFNLKEPHCRFVVMFYRRM
jgi:hypothetical protein